MAKHNKPASINQHLAQHAWQAGDPVKGGGTRVTQRCEQLVELVAKAEKRIEEMNKLLSDLTKYHTTPIQRVISFVLHSEQIKVLVEPHQFTSDWALIELYNEKFNWPNFNGQFFTFFSIRMLLWIQGSSLSHLFLLDSPLLSQRLILSWQFQPIITFLSSVGVNFLSAHFRKLMFVEPADCQYPEEVSSGQAFGVVPDAELCNPQHLEVHGETCMPVVKNGLNYGALPVAPTVPSIEVAVLPCDNNSVFIRYAT